MGTCYNRGQIFRYKILRAIQKRTLVRSRYHDLRALKLSAPNYTGKLMQFEARNGATMKGAAKTNY